MDQPIRTLPYGKLDMSTMTNDFCASHCCSFLGDATFSGTSVNAIKKVIKQCTSIYQSNLII